MPSGTGTTAHFELGTTTAYGTNTASTPVTTSGLVSATASGLKSDTVYHYRLVVTNDQGATVDGDDQTFRTAPPPAPPADPEVVTVTVPGPTITVSVPAPAPAAHAADTTAPVLSRLTFSATRLGPELSEAATVRVTVAVRKTRRVARGRRVRTVASWVTVRRATLRATRAGLATAKLGRRLPAGRYRATVRATDTAGNRSRAVTAQKTLRAS